MYVTGPYTPVVATLIRADDPAVYTQASVAVQVQNDSGFPLLVVTGGQQAAIPPFVAATMALNGSNEVDITPSTPPITSAGTIVLVWLLDGDVNPVSDGPLPGSVVVINDISNPIPVTTVGSTAYLSLTGPGETATPGDLTQAGGFDVEDSLAHGITFHSFGGAGDGSIYMEADGATSNISLVSQHTINLDATLSITIGTVAHTATVTLSPGAVVLGNTVGGSVLVGANDAALVGLFGTAPVSQGAIVGVLTAVTDPNAKAVMASIVNQLDRLGVIINGTT